MDPVGRYEITELLGQGGMGTVYKAYDPLLARVVAVKVISTQMHGQPELRERFFREARAAAQLDHPNIITVYDLGEQEGTPYLAMQFLEGRDLEQRMRDPGGMPLSGKIEIALQVASGLAHAHGSGIVHRDIKPANVFITDDGQVKILDFGLARLVTSELTRSNMMVGTVSYMAPEQLRAEKADHRADIFSLGVVLYKLIGGRKPFQAESFASTMYKILEETPEPLERLDPELPPRLIAVVDRALAKNPDHRYQVMADLIRDLEAAYEPIRGSDRRVINQLESTLRTGLGVRPKSNPSEVAADPDAPTVVASVPPGGWPASSVGPASVGQFSAPPQAPPPPGESSGVLSSRRGYALVAAGVAVMLVAGAYLLFRGGGPRPGSVVVEPAGPAAPAGVAASVPPPEAVSEPPAQEPAAPEPPAPESPVSQPPARPPEGRAQDALLARARAVEQQRVTRAAAALKTARSGAVAAGAAAAVPELFAAADKQAADAREANRRERFADAAARMEAATSMFATAEATARQQAEARAARARVAEQQRQAAEPPPLPATPPASAAVPPPAPAPAPPKAEPLEVPTATRVARDAAAEVLKRYVSALESRDITALQAIWPGLAGRERRAIETEFANARSISVEFVNPRADVSGARVTITGLRRYALQTRDGQNLRSETLTTLALKRAGNDWIIDSVRHRPAR